VSASFNGNPTDVAYKNGLLGVIDGTGAASHLSIFSVDGDGELNLKGVSTINSAANGVAVVDSEE
jgi:hypothetical protein